ncbi:MAG: hypothetical protein L0241_02975 [Planctomycetia bacterium]|nr:hypothetical protein [Planctomycetia bacterium]
MIDLNALKAAVGRTGHARELTLPGADVVLERWRVGLEEFVAYYQNRFGETVNPFEWWKANPAKARAFFDPDTLSLSAAMKAAVWRILLGYDIRKVELVYQPSPPSRVRLELSAPASSEIEPFESDAPEDAKLLRHLGSIRVNGQFQLQGYHAFATPAA